MGNKTLIRGMVIGIIVLVLFTVIMMVLVGKDGLINREVQDYNDTHIEENSERQNRKVVVDSDN